MVNESDLINNFINNAKRHLLYYADYLNKKQVNRIDVEKLEQITAEGKTVKQLKGSAILILQQSPRSVKIDLMQAGNISLLEKIEKSCRNAGYMTEMKNSGLYVSLQPITNEDRLKLKKEITAHKEEVKNRINFDRDEVRKVFLKKNSGFSEDEQRKMSKQVDTEKDKLYKELDTLLTKKEKEIMG